VAGLADHKSLRLSRPHTDLHVHVLSPYAGPLTAGYQKGAIYVAMASLLTGRRTRRDTAVSCVLLALIVRLAYSSRVPRSLDICGLSVGCFSVCRSSAT
jgi:hypothetical protein